VALLAIRYVGAITCLLVMHGTIIYGAYAEAVAVGLAYSTLNLAVACAAAGARALRGPWIAPVVLMLSAEIAVLCGYGSAVALVLAPSVVMNSLLLLAFGHTLIPGNEPLITRFRRAEVGYVTPPFVFYTRRLTYLWTLLFAVATVSSLAAALWGNLAVWSWISLIAVPLVSAAFFLGEHVYRWVRYGP